MLHQPITAAPTTLDAIMAAAAELSHRDQVALIRALADDSLSWSYGADKIVAGCDRVTSDLDDEQITVECGLPPSDAFVCARMGGTL